RIGVSRAFPIASTYPAVALVFGLVFLHERVDAAVVVGLLLVLGGVILVSRPHFDLEAERGAFMTWGIPFALLAAFSWGAATVLLGPGIEGLDVIMVASIRTPALSLMLWGIVALRGTFPRLLTLSRTEWLTLIVGGLVAWGLGSFFFLRAVSLIGPTRTAILTSTAPLFALPMNVVFLKEKVNLVILIGTVLAVAGIALVS
ncbi:MAG: hypothetical protein A2Y73_06945, partial [Chloroflexi bacterium RBG_13_56_8]